MVIEEHMVLLSEEERRVESVRLALELKKKAIASSKLQSANDDGDGDSEGRGDDDGRGHGHGHGEQNDSDGGDSSSSSRSNNSKYIYLERINDVLHCQHCNNKFTAIGSVACKSSVRTASCCSEPTALDGSSSSSSGSGSSGSSSNSAVVQHPRTSTVTSRTFTNRSPKVLDCAHFFCVDCLVSLAQEKMQLGLGLGLGSSG